MPRFTLRPWSTHNFLRLIQPSTQFLHPICTFPFPEQPSLPLQAAQVSNTVHHVSFLFCPTPRTIAPCGLPGFIRAPGRPPGVIQYVRVSLFLRPTIYFSSISWKPGRAGPFFWLRHRFLANCCFTLPNHNHATIRDTSPYSTPPCIEGAPRPLMCPYLPSPPSGTNLVKLIPELFLSKYYYSSLIPYMVLLVSARQLMIDRFNRVTSNATFAAANMRDDEIIDIDEDPSAANAASAQQTGVSNNNK